VASTGILGTNQSYLGEGQGNVAATIHFTQGLKDGGSGQSALSFDSGAVVTMTDDDGAGATSYNWEIVNWPAPLSSPPVITNSTTQVATCTPVQDGVYIVKLTRVDGAITTTDVKFFGVADADGLHLPVAGMTGNMANVGATPLLAKAAGWMGRADASTNNLLDAYLRWVKAASKNAQAFSLVSGSQTHNLDTFKRIGTLQIDPTKYPSYVTARFQAIIEATGTKTAEIRLYNFTDGGVVAGSTLTAPASDPTVVEATVTLPSALKEYEVQLRMTTVDLINTDSVTCTNARILLAW
jgi:hypothetical protein